MLYLRDFYQKIPEPKACNCAGEGASDVEDDSLSVSPAALLQAVTRSSLESDHDHATTTLSSDYVTITI